MLKLVRSHLRRLIASLFASFMVQPLIAVKLLARTLYKFRSMLTYKKRRDLHFPRRRLNRSLFSVLILCLDTTHAGALC
jgi:hypothetical protein